MYEEESLVGLEKLRSCTTFILKKGGVNVTFKQLFDDDAVANSLESLAGTLKAAKKKKLVDYEPELLLQVSQPVGVGGGVDIRGTCWPSKKCNDSHCRVPAMMRS